MGKFRGLRAKFVTESQFGWWEDPVPGPLKEPIPALERSLVVETCLRFLLETVCSVLSPITNPRCPN